MMSRLYTPGKLFDSVLVLAGLQGVGKGRMFKALAGESADGESYYSGTARHKDTAQAALQGLRTWVWEDQEMNNHKGAGSDKAKQWVTEAVDLCRLPYGKKVKDLKRHFVPCGSTNDPMKLLNDSSGSRRYNVVRIPSFPHQGEETEGQPEIDVDGVEAVRDQLLAEARDRFKKGERFHLTRKDKNYQLRAKVNRTMFTVTSDLDDFVAGVYRRNSGGLDAAVGVYEVYSAYAGEDAKRPDMLKGRAQHLVLDALRKANFTGPHHKRGGNVWVKALTPDEQAKVRAVNKGLYSSASDADFKGKPFAKAGDDGYFDANFR
jgi:predicted P-loop ATPase